jgi:mannose-6-phosphate isomerase-like protein (cupin superfamily)
MHPIKFVCGMFAAALCAMPLYAQAPAGGEEHPAVPGVTDVTPPKDRGVYFRAEDIESWYTAQAAGKIPATAWLLFSEPYELEVRRLDKPQTIAVHCCKADLWIVRSGEGTFTTGMDLVDGKPTGGEHPGMTARAIRNGVSRAVKAGDIIVVPPGVGHGFTEIKTPVEALFLGYEVPDEKSHAK